MCAIAHTVLNPYEIWQSQDKAWEWRVLKKYQADDTKKNARWFCGVKSPFTDGEFEYGDIFVAEIKSVARKIK